jgi:hypothetical protein
LGWGVQVSGDMEVDEFDACRPVYVLQPRAKRRGWITSASAGVDVTINTGGPRVIQYRWRTEEDDRRDAEAAEAERLRDEGKTVVGIGWGDGGKPKAFEQGLKSCQTLDKAGDSTDCCRSTMAGARVIVGGVRT